MIPKKLIQTINVQDLIDENVLGVFGYIFDYDSNLTNPNFAWLTEDLATLLDIEYYTIRSADKFISKQFERYIKMEEDEIIGVNPLIPLSIIIENKFKDKWNKLYSAFIESNYKPLENYDMKEKETPNLTRTKNVNLKTTVDNDVYGFNSSSPVPQSKSETSGNKLENEESESNTGTRDLERHGNIGVTTSQQMLKSEIDLRKSFNFMDEIMNDVDSILCLLVY